MRSRRGVPLVLALVLGFGGIGCTSGRDEKQAAATWNPVGCPPEIAVAILSTISCGYVAVPEDRTKPAGPQVRVFVFRISPDTSPTAPPVIYLGGEIAFGSVYSEVAALTSDLAVTASLPGHELIGVELRGTGHSRPNLSCPEVDALSGRARAEPIDDPRIRHAFLDAVASCRGRIASQGIDLAAFDIPAMAADVLDVVGALGLRSWELLSKGSTSRVVFEAMRADPPGLAGVVLYNPEFPNTDPFVQAIEGTRASIAQLAMACNADPPCARSFPAVAEDVRGAIERLQAHPVLVRVGSARVLMDGAALLRNLRARLSQVVGEQSTIARLPATIAAIAHARDLSGGLEGLASLDATSQTYCAGYLPTCGAVRGFSQGVYYSVLCRDEAPFADLGSLPGLAAGDAAWVADFARGPYLDVCAAWGVPAAGDGVTEPITSDVPVYIDSGAFSPFVTPAVVRGSIAGLSRVSLAVSPVNSDPARFSLKGPRCAFLWRAFLDDPKKPVDRGCYADDRLTFVDASI